MSFVTTPSVVRQIGALFDGGSVTGLTDRQLIERFNDRRDAIGEAAFAALVARHGAMVLHVCRQLLGDQHHAEDAFQAVFLVLARKARSIRDPDLLGNWLYGVALRTARKARVRIARRRKNEEGDAMRRPSSSPGVPAEQPVLAREQAEALYREIDRLPGPFRQTVVLCYFEGLTLEEAARRLRCPAGTVRSRLARACDKLRRGLTRRGVSLSGAALVAALSPRSASASISSPLCDITTRAAMNFAAGQAAAGTTSASAMALAQEVLRSMLLHKLKLTAFTLLFLGSIATGAGYLTFALAMKDEPRKVPAAPRPQTGARPIDVAQTPVPGRMFVTGRVLDPQGKPVPNATVMVNGRLKMSGRGDGFASLSPVPIGHAGGDGSGRFRIDAPRTSSSQYDNFCAVALAPGYGVGWVKLDPDTEQPIAEISLQPEQVIHGRLFDLQGRPARDVTVSVWSIGRILAQEPDPVRSRFNRFDGISYFWTNLNVFPAWPRPVTTDSEGRFTLRGVGRDLQAGLTVNDPRFARQRLEIETNSTSESKPLTMAVIPAQILTGRVTYADTGKPVPHAQLSVGASKGNMVTPIEFETDGEGRFRVNPSPGDGFSVSVLPPEGQPYLTASKYLDWPKGAVEQSVDLALPRGVVIRGKVTEEGSGQPVAGAIVWYQGRRSTDELNPRVSKSRSGPDGSYQFAVRSGPGHLVIEGPSDDYVLREIGYRMLDQGEPGGRRAYSHAFIACDPQSGSNGLEINVGLRRGRTVQGRILAPDGQPTQDTWILSRVILDPFPRPWRFWMTSFSYGTVRNGGFQIHGLDPDTEVPVYFLDPKRRLGSSAHLSGKSAAGEPVTIRLEPCGTATARLVDPGGKPIAGCPGSRLVAMVITPGPFSGRAPEKEDRLAADAPVLAGIDPINYGNGPVSDAQGQIAFPALVPGATYRVFPFRKEFTVKPGETLDLGDILIEKPET